MRLKYLLASLIGVYLAHGARIDTSQILTSSLSAAEQVDASIAKHDNPNPRAESDWTAFQQKYGGMDLKLKEFSPLYWWKPQRPDLEKTETPEYIVDLFRQTFAHMIKEDDDVYALASTQEVRAFANLGKLQAADLEDIDMAVNSPLAIAQTLYDVIISHLPKAEIGAQIEKSDGTFPFQDFIKSFRNGNKDRGLKGIEERVRGWVVALHMATQDYFAAKATGKSTSSRMLAYAKSNAHLGSANRKKASAKEALKHVLDDVVQELYALAVGNFEGDAAKWEQPPGEIVTKWMPLLTELDEGVSQAYDNRELDASLEKPIDTTIISTGYLDGFTLGVGFLDNFVGLNTKKVGPKTVQLTTLDDAFEHGYIRQELDEIQVNIMDLQTCFVKLAEQLDHVRTHFHDWKLKSLQKADPAVQAANLAWTQSAWDDLGIEIPGTVTENRESRQLRRLQGMVNMRALPDDSDPTQVGFTFTPTAGSPTMLEYTYLNVGNFLKGKELTMFIQLSADAGEFVKLYLNSPDIPSMLPTSARTFTFKRVPSIASFQPALGELTGLSDDLIQQTGTAWYVKEQKGKMLGMAKGSMATLAAAETGDPTPCVLRNEDNSEIGAIAIMHGGARAFSQMALTDFSVL